MSLKREENRAHTPSLEAYHCCTPATMVDNANQKDEQNVKEGSLTTSRTEIK